MTPLSGFFSTGRNELPRLPKRSMKVIEGMLGPKQRPVVRAYWRQAWRPVPKNQVGIKRFYMVGPLDETIKTPWGARSLARRRAKNKIAKQSRKVNRGKTS